MCDADVMQMQMWSVMQMWDADVGCRCDQCVCDVDATCNADAIYDADVTRACAMQM